MKTTYINVECIHDIIRVVAYRFLWKVVKHVYILIRMFVYFLDFLGILYILLEITIVLSV